MASRHSIGHGIYYILCPGSGWLVKLKPQIADAMGTRIGPI